MKIKIKKMHPNTVVPKYACKGDAGLDLTAVAIEHDKYGNVVCDTGLAFEIPDGYVGLLFPRSSIANKQLTLSNSVGVLDSSYRGSVTFKFKPTNGRELVSDPYEVGDRIGQIIIMPIPSIEFVEVDELNNTERGSGGYGHTGR